jgi:GNAT superfamily N-acetyltransferase
MSVMADTLEFHPATASPEEWMRYHVYRRQWQRERRPDEPLAPDDVARKRLERPDGRHYNFWYHVVDGDEMIAELHCEGPRPESPEYESNKHLMWVFAYVLKAHRRQGVGRSLVRPAVARMTEVGATIASSVAEDEPGHAFVSGLGAEAKLVERASRLDLAAVDWDMVDSWVREGQERSPGARLDLYPEWVPDELLEDHCVQMTELLNLMPWEGMEHGEIVITADTNREWRERMTAIGSTNPTIVVREADGSMSGMTDVLKHPHEPGIVRQMFTGVHPRARGRGMGKWVKAAMLRHVREAYPDTRWISTENAGSNDSMLAINNALGFQLHRVETFYQVDRAMLEKAVS